MRRTKTDLLGDLVRYVNRLEPGSKTVSYMTALLMSWKHMDAAEVRDIIHETMTALDSYTTIQATKDLEH